LEAKRWPPIRRKAHVKEWIAKVFNLLMRFIGRNISGKMA